MKHSKTVDEAVRRMWATLASVSAKRAVAAIHYRDSATEAERHAFTTERWLGKAGANATKWYFTQPNIPS